MKNLNPTLNYVLGLNTTQVSCDSSACNDVEAQFKDTTSMI